MLALLKNGEVTQRVSEGGWFSLPDGSLVSPAYDGWSNEEYCLKTIAPAAPIPEGMRVVDTHIVVADGVPLFVDDLEEDAPDYGSLAQALLELGDRVVIRCYEASVPVPEAWSTYRATLRDIASGSASGPLPTQPPYPEGT